MEKCLICIICQTRGYQLTWDSFKKNVMDHLGADLALCVGKTENDAKSRNGYYENAKYIWEYEEPLDYADAYEYVKGTVGSTEEWRLLLKVKKQWMGGINDEESHPGSAGIIIFYRWLLNKNIIDNDLINKYDRFIVTRSDYMYCAPHPPLNLISPKYIWIPEGEDYGGYTDRHLVSSNEDIIQCLDLMNNIITQPQKMYARMRFYNNWNLERYIMFHFIQKGLDRKVRRFPLVMFTVRGKNDTTRWMPGKYNTDLECFVKYGSEFLISHEKYCKIIKDNKDWEKILPTYKYQFELNPYLKYVFFKLLASIPDIIL